MTSQNTSHVPLEKIPARKSETRPSSAPHTPQKLQSPYVYVMGLRVGNCGKQLSTLGDPSKNNSRDIQTLDETPALVTKNKSCGRNLLRRMVLHLVNRYALTSDNLEFLFTLHDKATHDFSVHPPAQLSKKHVVMPLAKE